MKFVSALVNLARCYTSQTELFFPRKMCTANCIDDCLIRPSYYIPTYMKHHRRSLPRPSETTARPALTSPGRL
ncbi:hypothetical protein B296_00032885 [Ensete ventricosum]|uniref:Uncharacterized protein n=1 Tax=Ensete ventricosum TaxID=4639 RepID=A0A426ZY19_ENSVE|nr:hypothetical protein B296_00032885 [Ensete ventricosum]